MGEKRRACCWRAEVFVGRFKAGNDGGCDGLREVDRGKVLELGLAVDVVDTLG